MYIRLQKNACEKYQNLSKEEKQYGPERYKKLSEVEK